MKDTKIVLQEFFWKKNKKMPWDNNNVSIGKGKTINKGLKYTPADEKKTGFATVFEPEGFIVSDTAEVKKRLSSRLGVQLGSNTVKSMASRSIKSFPIIVSDAVDPSTAILLKKTIEEQYAEYVNLLISNKVIDLSDFRTDEDGNIALQALDVVDSADVRSKTLKRRAGKGELTLDDILGNLSAFELIRTEQKELKTGNAILDTLLENAVILDSEEKADVLIEAVSNFSDDLITLNEDIMLYEYNSDWWRQSRFEKERLFNAYQRDSGEPDWLRNATAQIRRNQSFEDAEKDERIEKLNTLLLSAFITTGLFDNPDLPNAYNDPENSEFLGFINNIVNGDNSVSDRDVNEFIRRRRQEDTRRTAEINRSEKTVRNTGPAALAKSASGRDTEEISKVLDDSIIEYFTNTKEGKEIKELYSKAVFLLTSRLISGYEFISYIRVRLGMPVDKKTEQRLLNNFPISELSTDAIGVDKIRTQNIHNIANNLPLVRKEKTLLTKYFDIIKSVGKKAAIGAGITAGGLTAGLGISSAITAAALTPVAPILIIAGFALGGYSLSKALKKKSVPHSNKIEPWVRVERLIQDIDENRRNAAKWAKNFREGKTDVNIRDFNRALNMVEKAIGEDFQYAMVTSLQESARTPEEEKFIENGARILIEELNKIPEVKAFLLEEQIKTEAIELSSMPTHLRKINKDKSLISVPEFGTRSALAYGDVEFDRRNIKDRGFNSPLILKIRFKERFEDGTFSDNELVAVIGILGVITRVPSEEMEVILRSNAEGVSIKGLIKGEENSLTKLIMGDTLSNLKDLKISKDVWAGLEKAANLARANSLAGRRNQIVANTHIIFSESEIEKVRNDIQVDYKLEIGLVRELMKKYSVFSVMIASDISERVYIFDDIDAKSWSVVGYNDIRGKSNGDMLSALVAKINN